MEKIAIALTAFLACLAIVLPVIGTVNHSLSTLQPAVEQADGNPLPAPILPWTATPADPTLVADGNPLPPPIPPWRPTASITA